MKRFKKLAAGFLSVILLAGSVLLPTGAVSAPPTGDIDQDGSVTVTDVVELRSLILSGLVTNNTKKRADIDGDGRLSVSDVVALRGIIMSGSDPVDPAQNAAITDGTVYAFENKNSGLALMVRNSSLDEGGSVCQWQYTGTGSDQWTARAAEDGYFALISVSSGLALTVDQTYTDSTEVTQQSYTGSDNQLFTFTKFDDGYYSIAPKNGETSVLDVSGNSMNNGGSIHLYHSHNGANQRWFATVVTPDTLTVPSEEAADKAYQNFLDAFLISDGNGGYNFENSNYFWDYAEMLEVMLDKYERNGTAEDLEIINGLYKGFTNRFGTSWMWNAYNDDIMWMVIFCCRAYNLTGNETFKTQAQTHFNSVYARAYNDDFGGGLYWKYGNNDTKNSCINDPAVIAACYLYDITKSEDYLAKAEKLFAWEVSTLFDAETGRVNDNINRENDAKEEQVNTAVYTYNQGTFIGAATLLYERTQTKAYIEYAKKAADFTMNDMYEGGVMSNENSGEDGIGFKGIFARWIGYYIDAQKDTDYNDWLAKNLIVGWANRNSVGVTATRWGRKTDESLVRPFSYSTYVALAQCFPYDTLTPDPDPDPDPDPEPTPDPDPSTASMFLSNANALLSATESQFNKDGVLAEDRGSYSPAYVWGYSTYLEALHAAVVNNPEDNELRQSYIDYLDGLEGYRQAGTDCYTAEYGGTGTVYFDDNMWLIMAYYKAYQTLEDASYLEQAEKIAVFCMTGWDDVLGGGIYWSDEKTTKNTCSNAPMALAAADLYKITGKAQYLEWAEKIYAWTKTNLQDTSDYLYYDHVSLDGTISQTKYTYNTGCMLAAAATLYDITKTESYLTDAKNIAGSATGYFFRERDGVYILGQGISKDPWFHTWLVDGYLRLNALTGDYAENMQVLISAVKNGYDTRDTATGLVYSGWRNERGDIDTLHDQAGTIRILYDLYAWSAAQK